MSSVRPEGPKITGSSGEDRGGYEYVYVRGARDELHGTFDKHNHSHLKAIGTKYQKLQSDRHAVLNCCTPYTYHHCIGCSNWQREGEPKCGTCNLQY